MQSTLKLIVSLLLVALIFILPGCAVIGGIFKAGVWVGVLIIAFVLGIIVWLVSRGSKKS